ncbi:hypothetical protein BGZ51_002056 [Haplosporangium sp. Z 767]|nr:hypothetical protein BGZ51_002056 [Haplosporangium sp. Z 767]
MEVVQPTAGQAVSPVTNVSMSTMANAQVPAMSFPHIHAPHSTLSAENPTTQSTDATTTTTAAYNISPSTTQRILSATDMNPDSRITDAGPSQESTSALTWTTEDKTKTAMQDSQHQQQLTKEEMIERVLQHGRVLKVSRRLRTRLEYAILKIRRGWSKYTLQEVESLIQPSMSPRLPSKRPLSTSVAASPRQSERKRVRKEFPDYEQTSETGYQQQHHSKRHDQEAADAQAENEDAPPTFSRQTSPTAAAASRRYKARPSFSQFKDSELFLPAKSLMEIATSSPSPSPGLSHVGSSLFAHQYGAHSPIGYGSPGPLYASPTPGSNWSSYSLPSSPVTASSAMMVQQETDDDRLDDSEAPSDTQAARTILLLASSPTRPPPRTLDPNYLLSRDRLQTSRSSSASPIMQHAELSVPTTSAAGPYSPMTSSPLVHFQTTASSPSPDQSPLSKVDNSPFLVKKTNKASTGSIASSSKNKQSTVNLYAAKHEPSSPLPLSTSSQPGGQSQNQSEITGSDNNSRFMARESDLNTTNESVIPGSQPQQQNQQQERTSRAVTPVKDEARPPSTPTTPQRASTTPETLHGFRTPPPSVGKESIFGHLYHPFSNTSSSSSGSPSGSGHRTVSESIAARRRNSGLAGGSGVDLITVFPKASDQQQQQ